MLEFPDRSSGPGGPPAPGAEAITRRAKSNLAFAFACVPRERRRDLTTFYAFCRSIDDIADDPGRPVSRRREELAAWREALAAPGGHPPGSLEAAIHDLWERHGLPPDHFLEIIEGCESDLDPQRFGTWDDLRGYTRRVAGAVGLVSLPLFGAGPASRDYALALADALQLTNILRDVGEDLRNGERIYLPLADLARFRYGERDLIGRVHDERFLALMEFEAGRAGELFARAAAALPAADRRALRPAEIMGAIYQGVLRKMRRDRFRVFDRRYRLSKIRKLAILVRVGRLWGFGTPGAG